MDSSTAFKLLNIPSNSSLRVIKKAYHNLALKFHPDKLDKLDKLDKSDKKGANNVDFSNIVLAYETLTKGSVAVTFDTTTGYDVNDVNVQVNSTVHSLSKKINVPGGSIGCIRSMVVVNTLTPLKFQTIYTIFLVTQQNL